MVTTRRGFGRVCVRLAAPAAIVLSASAGLAQESRTLVVFEHAGLASLLSDPRDAGVLRAFSMLPARLAELPGEVDGMGPEVVPMLDLALRTAAQPMRMAITYNAGDQSGGGFGYGLFISVRTDDEAASHRLDGLVRGAILEGGRLQPRASSRSPGMMDLMIPPIGLVTLGPRLSDDGPRYEAWLGSVPGPDAGVSDLPEPPPDVRVFARGSVDLRALNPAVDIVRGLAGQDAARMEPALRQLTDAGLLGADALRLSFQIGSNDREMIAQTELYGARTIASVIGLPAAALPPGAFRAIPADATMAFVKRVGAGDELLRLIDSTQRWTGGVLNLEETIADFRDTWGVDIRTDVLEALGDVQAFYMSDTTGGGSIMSSVLLLSVDDRPRIENAFMRLSAQATELIRMEEPEVGRYVRFHPWEHDGHRLISLRADGLPIPIELTVGLSDGWLVMAPSAQAAIAALRQAGGVGQDITSIPIVRESIERNGGAASLTFMDTARFARSGYAVTQMLGTALASGVRSPSGVRDPGTVVPGYHELLKGARSSVQVSYWRGDDYVSESRGDRSMLVNVSAAGGLLKEVLPLIAIPAMGAAAERGGFSDARGAVGPAFAAVREWIAPASPLERFALAMAVAGGFIPVWDVEGDLHDAWSEVMLAE